MATKTQTQHGIEDARTFASEHPEDVAGALEPGQLGADESLISAMGARATAKLFGVEPDSEAFSAACAEYGRAFDRELRRLAPEVIADAQRRADAEQEALDAVDRADTISYRGARVSVAEARRRWTEDLIDSGLTARDAEIQARRTFEGRSLLDIQTVIN